MWINPTEMRIVQNPNDFVWPVMGECLGFVMQGYDSEIDSVGAKPAQPFRIFFKNRNQNILIAQDKTKMNILRHWEWLENNIFRQLELLEDEEEDELIQFIIIKISTMIQCTELEDTLPKNNLDNPELFYKGIYPKLDLICCKQMN